MKFEKKKFATPQPLASNSPSTETNAVSNPETDLSESNQDELPNYSAATLGKEIDALLIQKSYIDRELKVARHTVKTEEQKLKELESALKERFTKVNQLNPKFTFSSD